MSAMRDPKSKSEILDSLLRIDYSGDMRDLAANRNVVIQRVKQNVVRLAFPGSGRVFDLTVHKRRAFNKKVMMTGPKRKPGRPRKNPEATVETEPVRGSRVTRGAVARGKGGRTKRGLPKAA